jgi:hypothetical protein
VDKSQRAVQLECSEEDEGIRKPNDREKMGAELVQDVTHSSTHGREIRPEQEQVLTQQREIEPQLLLWHGLRIVVFRQDFHFPCFI